MKHKIVLVLFAGFLVVLLSSYSSGYAAQGGGDGTGASGSTGCSCHGSTSSLGTTVELDSAGVRVTSYHPGQAYTVRISGTNNTTHTTLKRFGFQLATITSAGAGTNSAAQAGTWGTTLPASVQNTTAASGWGGNFDMIEHSAAILDSASTTGGVGSRYIESIPWTAPVSGTGAIKIYGIINAVNFNNSSSGDYSQAATAVTITEAVAVSLVASVHIAQTTGSNPTCAGTSVTFTATPTNGGNVPAYQWKVNGTNAGTNSATFTTTTLTTGAVVTCVMTSTLTGVTGSPATSNAITMTINQTVTPSVNITTASSTICAGTSTTFTATPTNGGNAPSYQWKVNGTNVGTNSTTYTSTTLTNGQIVTCVMTSTAACPSATTATSNGITMTVNPTVTPVISITTPTSTICPGTSVTVTATSTNGGTAPSYQWKVNGANVGTNSTTYTSTSPTNGQAVTCIMTSNVPCPSATTATSNAITITVTGTVTPTVSISPSATTICTGASVTFTATPGNGGTAPSYQWKVNGANAGTNSTTFTTTTLTNGQTVTCVMISNSSCASPATATSNAVTMTVNPILVSSVSIATVNTSVCGGTSVTFTATPVNGGTAPSYQWKVNGTNAGTNSATYTTTTLTNGQIVTCIMSSSAACASPATGTSNAVTMTVTPSVTPSVSISTPSTTTCTGSSATFTATPANGGTSPSYQWKVGTVNVGTNSPAYTTTTLTTGQVVSCVMTSNAPCASPLTVTSNAITMTVGTQTPTISITARAASICSGAPDTFAAQVTNGGSTPSFQWKINGTNAGTNSATFITSSLTAGAAVTCTLTSSLACASPASVTSNSVTVTISSSVVPTLAITTPTDTVCSGANTTFTATGTNLGTATYQWLLNGSPATVNSPTYIAASLVNGSTVSCIATSSLGCASPAQATSNTITMTVLAGAITITPSGSLTVCAGDSLLLTASGGISYLWTTTQTTDTIWVRTSGTYDVQGSTDHCSYPAGTAATVTVSTPTAPTVSQNRNMITSSAAVTYQWVLNGSPLPGDTLQSFTITQSGSYSVLIHDAAGCAISSHNYILSYVNSINSIGADLGVKVYPIPNQGLFMIEAADLSDADLSIYDIYGQKLYEQKLSSGHTQINVANLAPAMYYISVSDRGRTEAIKMQVAKE
jgi:hypothetical protein